MTDPLAPYIASPVGYAVAILVSGAVLLFAADKLVAHAEHLARSLRVPKAIVGAVILGFGTSVPELLVCLGAVNQGLPAQAAGNVFGSNIANVGLVLGGAAILAPVLVHRDLRRVSLPLGLVSSLVLTVFLLAGGELGRGAGIGMLVVFAVYLGVSIKAAGKHRGATALEPSTEPSHVKDTLWIVGALAAVAIGAHYFNLGANGVAQWLGVSDGVIGLSLVALGTSLPEVVTTIAAARQGQPDLAIGNVAGSNLFNLLFVLPATMLAKPLDIEPAMRQFDVPVMLLFAALAFPWPGRSRVIGRVHGLLLVSLYVAYQVFIFSQGRVPDTP